MKILSFKDLISWKEGHNLVLKVYNLTDTFPAKEQFSLTDHMRRCAVSITSNIAEGFSRKGSKEKSQFYYMALGSLTELENQLIIARDLGYIEYRSFQEVQPSLTTVNKLLHGLIKSCNSLYT